MGLTKPRAYQIYDLDYKQSVRVVTVANITLTGGAPSSVDGVNLSLNDRVLVTGQSTGSQNGIYYVTTVGTGSNGTWARSLDTNQTGELDSGTIVMVTEGNVYADTQWKLTTNDPIIIGSTTLTFVQNYSTNSISAGTSNVSVASNSNVSIAVASSNIVVFSSGTQNITANIIPTANVTYDLGNATNRFNDLYLANNSIFLGNVTLAATATELTVNGAAVITSSGSSTLSLTGNITGGNLISNALITGTTVTATGNVNGGNLNVTGNIVDTGELSLITGASGNVNLAPGGTNRIIATTTGANVTGTLGVTGNITGGNLSGTSIVGTLTTAAQTNITSVGTLGSLTVTANIAGGNLTTAGQVVAVGNITGGNIIANGRPLTSLNATNIDTGTLSQARLANSAVTLGSTALTLGSTVTTVAGLSSVTSTTFVGALTGAATTAGTVTTAAQPNITSVGTLGSLTVTANVAGGNITTAGQVAATGNITGGNVNAVGGTFTGNVAFGNIFVGGYYYANGVAFTGGGGGGTPGGANTQIQFNDGGVFGGSAGLTFNKTTNAVATTGTFSATGNISGGNVSGTRGAFTNVAGTLETAAQTNITSVGTLSSLTVTANVAGGNLTTVGQVSAVGNISGNFFIGNGRFLTGISASGGIAFTSQANTAPVSPNNGDFWFDTFSDIKYQYINDGTSSQWIDQSFPTSFSSISVGNITNSNANGVGNIGTSTTYFNTAFVKATSAQYADLAEMYEADGYYPPGHVVVFGGDKEITLSTRSHDTAVAGIISTNPSYLMNSTQSGEWVLAVALTGRVPCLVQGPVKKGDVLATGSKPGTAQRIGINWQPGCVIGKSLENISDDSVQVIEVAVGRF